MLHTFLYIDSNLNVVGYLNVRTDGTEIFCPASFFMIIDYASARENQRAQYSALRVSNLLSANIQETLN